MLFSVDAEAGHKIDGLIDSTEGGEYIQLAANVCGQVAQLLLGQEQVSGPVPLPVASQAAELAGVSHGLAESRNLDRALVEDIHKAVDEDEVRNSEVVELVAGEVCDGGHADTLRDVFARVNPKRWQADLTT